VITGTVVNGNWFIRPRVLRSNPSVGVKSEAELP
jgi:hypothetical protein